MKLVPAGGSSQMQRALTHPYVHTISSILLQHPELLRIVAPLLKAYDQHAQTGLSMALEKLRLSQSRPGDVGLTPPGYIVELATVLHNLYQQRDEDIRYQRGAILEVLIYQLVSPRYKVGECQSDYRFVDGQGKDVTEQIDIAAISPAKREIEGYECKIKAIGIESPHCTGLAYLAEVAQQEGYDANVGFVTLDDEKQVKRRIAHLHSSTTLKAYGLDNLESLGRNPF